ncbi:PREDICTED: TBC1 domain family member 25-like [Priapulus caudatus]|uniref:TBC1 domain family member 25-like n=1 Tax=Priapulus caudatus TaxID=37621 RepID=A0ABM1ED99_PRICU|nr:PREDICTED: TBC1 domain family member 25-like [Priapulus caudatus]
MACPFDMSEREAVRVRVKKCEGKMQPEYKKFSVDPQITTFEVLQSLLARAFQISGDFTISYMAFDNAGHELYLSLLSDWDLDAAFLSSSDPCLRLKVDLKPFEEGLEDWDVVSQNDAIPRQQFAVPNFMRYNVDRQALAGLTGSFLNQVRYVTNLVRKDVLRTDRTHAFYAGADDNKNTTALFNVLTTYAYAHPAVSYCQGMSDIASPLLVTMRDEACAYVCFCGLMQRLRPHFQLDGAAMTLKFQHLSELLHRCDPPFFAYLRAQGADDLLFCYRWLLLELKREFAFDDALYMLEVMWSTLPPAPPDGEIALADAGFEAAHAAAAVAACGVKENAYTRLRAIRRQTSLCGSPVVKDAPLTALSPDACCLQGGTGDGGDDAPSPDDTGALEYRSLTNAMTRQLRTELSSLNRAIATDERVDVESSASSAEGAAAAGDIIVHHRKDSDVGADDGSPTTARLAFATLKVRIERDGVCLTEETAPPHGGATIDQPALPHGVAIVDQPALPHGGATVELSAQDSVETEGNDNDVASLPEHYEYLTGGATGDVSDCDERETSVDSDIAVLPLPATAATWGSDGGAPAIDVANSGCWESASDGGGSSIAVLSLPGSQAASITRDTHDSPSPQPPPPPPPATSNLLRPSSLSNLKRFFSDRLQEMVSPSRPDPPELMNGGGSGGVAGGSDTPLSPASCVSARTEMGVSANSYESWSVVAEADAGEDMEFASVAGPRALPPPHEFGVGNPFLMFLCLTLLLQHRDYILRNRLDYNEIAMTFDRMVRSHDVHRVLHQGRAMYAEYLQRWQTSTTAGGEDMGDTGEVVDLSV